MVTGPRIDIITEGRFKDHPYKVSPIYYPQELMDHEAVFVVSNDAVRKNKLIFPDECLKIVLRKYHGEQVLDEKWKRFQDDIWSNNYIKNNA